MEFQKYNVKEKKKEKKERGKKRLFISLFYLTSNATLFILSYERIKVLF